MHDSLLQETFRSIFLAENKQNMIELHIIDNSGTVHSLNVDIRCKIDKVKLTAVSQIFRSSDSSKQSLYFKLVSVTHNRTLLETNSLAQENINSGDEILLLEKRIDVPEIEDSRNKTERLKAPIVQEIKAKTCNILPKNVTSHTSEDSANSAPSSAFLQEDCRKILVTLVDIAHRLHCMNAALGTVFSYPYEAKTDVPVAAAQPKLNYSHSKLRQLKMMGFSENLAKMALHKNNDVSTAAIQWLLDHNAASGDAASASVDIEQGVEVTEDTPLQGPGNGQSSSEAANAKRGQPVLTEDQDLNSNSKGTSEQIAQIHARKVTNHQEMKQKADSTRNDETRTRDGSDTNETEGATSSSMQFKSALNKMTGPAKVNKLMKSFKAFARDNYDANEQTVTRICEMGFARRDVLDALRIYEGRDGPACEWLLAGEHEKEQEITEGVDPDSPLFKEIQSNESVQLALQNPICIIAFMMMLESPAATERWLSNQEIGTLLATVANIYAKHDDTSASEKS